ncbi:type VI secretion system contractile sheath large subunit [Pseudomonas sp. NY15437]|uniref:type VI secretion system contractile sheath large subunit n=1 Tax=Pseudomonas sp. NY15437 TaxID=3400360 RepID=UPI003A865A99
MSVETSTVSATGNTVHTREAQGVYAALFDKINLNPVSSLTDIEAYQNTDVLSDVSADERVTAAVSVFLDLLKRSSQKVERLDKTLLDEHIAQLDEQISRQLDAIMHHPDFQRVESTWRGVKSLIDQTDFRQNVRIELLDVSKDHLVQDFEDAPEIAQSGLYVHTYTQEYDTPGGEPIAAAISNYEFDRGPRDIALLRSISKVAAAAHMPFIGSVGPAFFGKETMEEVAAIKDIGNYFDRAEYLKWKSFRDSDDARYIGLTMPRVLGRLPYGPDTVPVRSFNYIENVKGPDHDKYLWTNATFSFAANMVKSFINNGWCVQIRGPQAGGAVTDLPIHLYDLGTGNQVKIPSEVMIPETREFEFANLGFIPLSYYKNRDYRQTLDQALQRWWQRRSAALPVDQVLLLGPAGDAQVYYQGLMAATAMPQPETDASGTRLRCQAARSTGEQRVLGLGRHLARLALALPGREERWPRLCGLAWMGDASSESVFLDTLATAGVTVLDTRWQLNSLDDLDALIDAFPQACPEEGDCLLCAGVVSRNEADEGEVPGEAGFVWVVGRKGTLRLHRGEYLLAEKGESASELCSQMQRYAGLTEAPADCLALDAASVGAFVDGGWAAAQHPLADYWGALGELAPFVGMSLAAFQTAESGNACGWLGKDEAGRLAMGVVVSHGD